MRIITICATMIVCSLQLHAQVKPVVSCIGGDDVPVLKRTIENRLAVVLLEMNRINKGTGSVDALKEFFSPEAFPLFRLFVLNNKAYTARREYKPQMIEREKGEVFDIRSVTVRVMLGDTQTGDNQNLIFSFNKSGVIISVRSVLPNYDYHMVVAEGKTATDSLIRGVILDFMEQFRMAYNSKNLPFLEKMYSDEALIFVGTVIEEKKGSADMMKQSNLSGQKVKLIQQTKRQYLDGLRDRAFKMN